MRKYKKQSGYIILILSIVVTSVGVYLALNSAVLASQSRLNNQSTVESLQAESLARRCSELAIQRLQNNRYYDGDEVINLSGDESCEIYTISGIGNSPRTIITSGQTENVTRYIETKLSQIAPRILIRFQSLIVSPSESTDSQAQILAVNSPSKTQTNSLEFWFRPSNLISLNNARVPEWFDSWSGITLTQSDPLQQPTYLIRYLNRRPALQFTSGQILQSLDFDTILTDPDIIILGVASVNGNPDSLVTTESGWNPAWTQVNINDLSLQSTNLIVLELVGYIGELQESDRNALQTYFTTKYAL